VSVLTNVSSPRVLIADPDHASRALYRESFARASCDVVEAEDGRDALVKAFVRVPSLVVTELQLPAVDGFALCEFLRADSTTANVPIIVVTTEQSRDALRRARHAGADSIMMKPARPHALIGEMRRLITHSQELRDRSTIARARARVQLEKSAELFSRAARSQRARMAKAAASSALVCGKCASPLQYERSEVTGIREGAIDRWDYFRCPNGCARYEFHQKTGKLRLVG
jgi:DNA-binding response OmpR family regulator